MTLHFEDSNVAVTRQLKILIYGGPGSGKTWFAIHAPTPLIFDTESSTDAYRGRADMPHFIVAKSAIPSEILPALETLQQQGAINGFKPETIVIDSFSVLWQVSQEAGQKIAERRAVNAKRNAEEARLAFGDWALIKRPVQRFYTQLINLPTHVIITARQKDLYDENTKEPKKIGETPDMERNAPYVFDLVLHLVLENGKRIGIIEKSRFPDFPPGKRIVNPTWDDFKALTMVGPGSGQIEDVDTAASAEAVSMEQSKPTPKTPPQRSPEPERITDDDYAPFTPTEFPAGRSEPESTPPLNGNELLSYQTLQQVIEAVITMSPDIDPADEKTAKYHAGGRIKKALGYETKVGWNVIFNCNIPVAEVFAAVEAYIAAQENANLDPDASITATKGEPF